MTLIEVLLAIVIIAIAVIGASGYRYFAALDARKASTRSTAARIALLLSENWRGLGYDRIGLYEPATHFKDEDPGELEVSDPFATRGPGSDGNFDRFLGQYEITANNTQFWATLAWKQEAANLIALNTVVAWEARKGNKGESGNIVVNRTFKLTTFVSN